MAGEDKRSTAASLIRAAPRMFDERRDAYEFGREEAQEEDAEAQAPQDAQEDALAAEAQVAAPPKFGRRNVEKGLGFVGALSLRLAQGSLATLAT